MDDKHTYRNYYFKVEHGGPRLMSGLPLPNPKEGPYIFIGCTFHPAIWDELKKNYKDSHFNRCDYP